MIWKWIEQQSGLTTIRHAYPRDGDWSLCGLKFRRHDRNLRVRPKVHLSPQCKLCLRSLRSRGLIK